MVALVEQVTGQTASGRGRGSRAEFLRLRGDCQAKMNELGLVLPVPFTLEGFCQRLGACLDREILLRPVDTRFGPCGLWVATDDYDVFFFERRTSPLHQAGIVGHEGGHRAFGHESATVDAAELARLLGLDVGLIRLVLGRTTYAEDKEQLAEVFGTLVVEHAQHGTRPLRPSVDPVLARVQTGIGPAGDPDG